MNHEEFNQLSEREQQRVMRELKERQGNLFGAGAALAVIYTVIMVLALSSIG